MPSVHADRLEPLARRPLPLAVNRVYRQWIGGAILDRLQGRPEPRDGHFPEEWAGSTTVTRLDGRPPDEGLSRILRPDGSPLLLRALIEACPEAMLGGAHVARFGSELGILCKILDSAMRLSIQAHPTPAFSRAHLGSPYGKTEAWMILATRTIDGVSPYILYGFREGVGEADFRSATARQDVPALVAALNRLEVHPGEVYLVPAGTPHALGPGVLLVEVQEPTDFVVNAEAVCGEIRRSEAQCFMGLSFEAAMGCFDAAAAGPECVRRGRLIPRPLRRDAEAEEDRLVGPEETPCFEVTRLILRGGATERGCGRACIGIVAGGRGRLIHADGEIPLRPAATLFVPAAAEPFRLEALPEEPVCLLKCFPPAP
ncbi:MAG: class I mannose-6-phosphate isomerase [Candidatus Methylomirabilota bacterium]